MTEGNLRRLAWILTFLLAIGAGVEAGDGKKTSWTLKSALKQIDKTVKKYHAATGQAQWDQLLSEDEVHGSGAVRVDFSGRIRVDVAGNNPRTLMAVPPYLYIYKPLQQVTDSYFLPSNRSVLAQYAMVGFLVAGNDMTTWFDLKLVRQEELDGHATVLFSLTPRPSKDPLSISNFLLWVDTTSWLPVQQVIRDEASGMQVTVKYSDLEPVDALPPDTFTTAWPDGTPVVKH